MQFAAAANSFFTILVFNDVLRGPEPGSIALLPAAGVNAPGYSTLPMPLARSLNQLIVDILEKAVQKRDGQPVGAGVGSAHQHRN